MVTNNVKQFHSWFVRTRYVTINSVLQTCFLSKYTVLYENTLLKIFLKG